MLPVHVRRSSVILWAPLPADATDSVAGADSSAYAMNMTLASLLTNPRAYLALRSEIDAAIASSRIQDSGKPVTDAEARSLPYLQGVLREGLRMFPPLIGLVSKQVPPDGDVINGYFVPGGTQIGHNIYGVGRLKSFWGEDADIFRPERWLEAGFGTEREKEMLAVLDLNFGSGKYQCLGKNIANMELNKVFVEVRLFFSFRVLILLGLLTKGSSYCEGLILVWSIQRIPSISKVRHL